MFINNAIGHGETQAGALSHPLGGEKWVKYFVLVFSRNTGAVVADHTGERLSMVSGKGGYQQAASLLHGVMCIVDQVKKDLAQFFRVSVNFRQALAQLFFDFNMIHMQRMLGEGDYLVNNIINLEGTFFTDRLAGKLEQVGDDFAAGLGLSFNDHKVLVLFAFFFEIILHELGVAKNDT